MNLPRQSLYVATYTKNKLELFIEISKKLD